MSWSDKGWGDAAREYRGQADQRNLASGAADQKKRADDWLADFAKKSQEALAKKAAEKQVRPPPNEVAIIEALARKSDMEYDKVRSEVAETLGIRVTTLDDRVAALREALAAGVQAGKLLEMDPVAAEAAAGDLISDPDILARFGSEVEKAGLVGETDNAQILYLALTSRLLERPASIAIKGVSSGGKSFTVDQVLKFFPPSAYFVRSGMSERAIVYSDEDYRHRFIVIFEAAGMNSDLMSYLIRTLLSEQRIVYEVVEKTSEGLRPRRIEKEGPTGLITTTTAAKLHPENETRLLSLGVVDTPNQTRAVMRALADGNLAGADYSPWQALQTWLATGERRVVVPFAKTLAENIPPVAVRLRRDFKLLLTLIHAHALLHRATRARDDQGRIVATVADYTAVCDLVEKLFSEGIEATVPATVRETVAAVGACVGEGGEVSLTALAYYMGLDKNSAHHRVRKAIDRGYLVNREEKRGMPARIALADPLPDEIVILPDPEVLERWSADGGEIKGAEADVDEGPFLLPDSHSNTPTVPPAGDGTPPAPVVCAQCNSGGGPLAQIEGSDPPVWLHPECCRFWFKEHPQARKTAS